MDGCGGDVDRDLLWDEELDDLRLCFFLFSCKLACPLSSEAESEEESEEEDDDEDELEELEEDPDEESEKMPECFLRSMLSVKAASSGNLD